MIEGVFAVHPPLSCRTSPSQGGRLAGRTGFPQTCKLADCVTHMERAGRALHRISPLEREMSGRTEGGEPRMIWVKGEKQ